MRARKCLGNPFLKIGSSRHSRPAPSCSGAAVRYDFKANGTFDRPISMRGIIAPPVSLTSRPIQDVLRLCTEQSTAESWEELVNRTLPLLRGAIRRTCQRYGLNPAEVADDLLQEAYLKISANRGEILQKFVMEDAEAVYPYLKVVAVNLVTDYCRSKEAARRRASQTVPLQTEVMGAEPIGQTSKEIEKTLLLGQIDHILVQHVRGPTAKRDRSVFWLYYRQGLTSKAIAAIPGVELSTKGVETLIFRLTKAVRTEIAVGRSNKAGTEGKVASNPLMRESEG
jgi:RNA polymerase sigma-70 factor, ECF subfamily